MSSSSSLEKFLFGALLGGAIGALLAVLTAPRSGEETRKLLSEELSSRYDDSRKVLGDSLETSKTKLNETLESSRETLNKSLSSAKEVGSFLGEKAGKLSGELKATGQEAMGMLKKEAPTHPEMVEAE